MRFAFLCIFFGLVLSNCSVRYTPRIPGFQPGYTDLRLGERSYQVTIGEAWPKDWRDLEKFALYRAAELTKGMGLRYFAILDSSTQTTQTTINTPSNSYTTGTASIYGNTAIVNTRTVTNPGAPITLQGRFYRLEFEALTGLNESKGRAVKDSQEVMDSLKYFIGARR